MAFKTRNHQRLQVHLSALTFRLQLTASGNHGSPKKPRQPPPPPPPPRPPAAVKADSAGSEVSVDVAWSCAWRNAETQTAETEREGERERRGECREKERERDGRKRGESAAGLTPGLSLHCNPGLGRCVGQRGAETAPPRLKNRLPRVTHSLGGAAPPCIWRAALEGCYPSSLWEIGALRCVFPSLPLTDCLISGPSPARGLSASKYNV